MSRARVVVVCSNVSNNCLGRALLLADLAKPFADVSVAGANLSRDPIWGPASGFDVAVESVELHSVFGYVAAGHWLKRHLSGAKVIVSKPLPSSLGLARRAGVRNDQMLLDVDDWEVGLFSGAPRAGPVLELARHAIGQNKDWRIRRKVAALNGQFTMRTGRRPALTSGYALARKIITARGKLRSVSGKSSGLGLAGLLPNN